MIVLHIALAFAAIFSAAALAVYLFKGFKELYWF